MFPYTSRICFLVSMIEWFLIAYNYLPLDSLLLPANIQHSNFIFFHLYFYNAGVVSCSYYLYRYIKPQQNA
jgi:hypothetical protein